MRLPRNRSNLIRMADDRLARELAEWVGVVAFTLAMLSIPWLLGHIALALGVGS